MNSQDVSVGYVFTADEIWMLSALLDMTPPAELSWNEPSRDCCQSILDELEQSGVLLRDDKTVVLDAIAALLTRALCEPRWLFKTRLADDIYMIYAGEEIAVFVKGLSESSWLISPYPQASDAFRALIELIPQEQSTLEVKLERPQGVESMEITREILEKWQNAGNDARY